MATKIAGPSGEMTWLRGGPPSLDAANIAAAIDGSLLRLGVDCLDLVYLHWPDRCVVMVGTCVLLHVISTYACVSTYIFGCHQ